MTTQVSGPEVHEQVAPPGDAVTVYPVIVAPPFDPGAVHDTTTWVLPDAPTTLVGAPGTVAGVTATDGTEASPGPALLVAVTVNV